MSIMPPPILAGSIVTTTETVTATAMTAATTSTVTVDKYVLTLMGLPIKVRIDILNYFDENKQDELRTLTVISKGMNEDCKRSGIVWKLIPEFVLSPKYDHAGNLPEDGGSTSDLLRHLSQYQQDNDTYNKLQTYRIFKVNEVNKFNDCSFLYPSSGILWKEYNFRMEGIRSLNMSLPPSTKFTTRGANNISMTLPRALFRILPNIRVLDLSNWVVGYHSGKFIEDFSTNWPYLEKITWNNIPRWTEIYLDGIDMRSWKNLNEIIMDNCTFYCAYGMLNWMSDLTTNQSSSRPKYFLFHRCRKGLERVSIQNATCYDTRGCNIIIPQSALIKFVRNVPTLKWFRSNLTEKNIYMLQKERPLIELLN